MPRSKNRFIAYLILLINTAIWGLSSPIIKYAFQFTSPLQFLFFRYLIAAAVFLPIFLLYRSRHQVKIHHLQTVILAFIGTPLCLIPLFYGLNQTTALEASILEASSPIFTIVMAVIFLKDKLQSKELKGLLIAIAGTAMIALEPIITGHNHVQLSVEGNLLIIISNIAWTIFLLLSKKYKTDPVYLSFYSFVISIPIFFLLICSQNNSFSLDLRALPSILYMAIFGSIIAFWTYLEGQKRIEASEAAVFTYLKPLFAIPLSILWLHESFSPVAIIATVLIAVGVYTSESR